MFSYVIFSVVMRSMSFNSCLLASANSLEFALDATEIACSYRFWRFVCFCRRNLCSS